MVALGEVFLREYAECHADGDNDAGVIPDVGSGGAINALTRLKELYPEAIELRKLLIAVTLTFVRMKSLFLFMRRNSQ